MIGYRKILIGHFMTSYKILRYLFEISRMLLSGISVGSPLSSGTIWGILRIKCAVWVINIRIKKSFFSLV